jgi:hypothetical protein
MKQNTVHLFIFDSLSDWEIGYLTSSAFTLPKSSMPDTSCSRPETYRTTLFLPNNGSLFALLSFLALFLLLP